MDWHIPWILGKVRWEIEKGTSLNVVAFLTFDMLTSVITPGPSKHLRSLSLSLSFFYLIGDRWMYTHTMFYILHDCWLLFNLWVGRMERPSLPREAPKSWATLLATTLVSWYLGARVATWDMAYPTECFFFKKNVCSSMHPYGWIDSITETSSCNHATYINTCAINQVRKS